MSNPDVQMDRAVDIVMGVVAARQRGDAEACAALFAGYVIDAVAQGVEPDAAWRTLTCASIIWCESLVGDLAKVGGLDPQVLAKDLALDHLAAVSSA